MKKVVVGLSGGVDSAVAAYLLKESGYEVTGVHLNLVGNAEGDAAKAVAEHLGISYKELDFREDFQKSVKEYFVTEYLAGRTPNPCCRCNRIIKFEKLLEWAQENEIEYDNPVVQKFDSLVERCYLQLDDDDKKYNVTQEVKLQRYENYWKPLIEELRNSIISENKDVINIFNQINENDNVENIKQKLDECYIKLQEKIKADYEREKIPYVELHYSESSKLYDNKIYTLKEFNDIITKLDTEFHNRKEYAELKYGSVDNYFNIEQAGKLPEEDKNIQFGYDKTEFTVFNIPNPDNPEDTYSYSASRFDIGDGYGSVFDFIRVTCSYDEIIKSMNSLERKIYQPSVSKDYREKIDTLFEDKNKVLKENLNTVFEKLNNANKKYKELHQSFIIDASEADDINEKLNNGLNEIKETYETAIQDVYKQFLTEYEINERYNSIKKDQTLTYLSSKAKQMLLSNLYQVSRDSQKAMNNGESFKTDWDLQRKIFDVFPAVCNIGNYTDTLLESTVSGLGKNIESTVEQTTAEQLTDKEIKEGKTLAADAEKEILQKKYDSETGKNYDHNLTTTDIAKKLREYIKKNHPGYKFSVTSQYYSGGSSISVNLKEAPVPIADFNSIKNYCENDKKVRFFDYNKKTYVQYGDLITDIEKKEFIENLLNNSSFYDINKFHREYMDYMTPEVKNVITDVINYLESYNYDHSDLQTDYYDVNFHSDYRISKEAVNKSYLKIVTNNSKGILDNFSSWYDYFYSNADNKTIQNSINKINGIYDSERKNNELFNKVINSLAEERKDMFTSDREVASIMMSLSNTGYLKNIIDLNNYDFNETVSDIINIQHENSEKNKEVIWKWIRYDDGSGCLEGPSGNQYFSYDNSTGEYKIYESDRWLLQSEINQNISFKEYAENYIRENIDTNANIKFIDVLITEEEYFGINNENISDEELDICNKVLPAEQLKLTLELSKGEEGEFYKNKLKEIADTYKKINSDTELTNEDGTHNLGFHYFLGNTDIYISEIDSDGIGFGYTILNGDLEMSEWGSSSIEEIISIPNMEMDYHVPDNITIEKMLYNKNPDYFSEYETKKDLFNVINFTNWTYFNSEKISTKVYDVEISASLYEQLLPSEYKERSIKEDEVVCIQYRKSVVSEEQDQFLISKFNKNNFMLLQQKEIQIDDELKNKIKSICNSYIEPKNDNSYTNEIIEKIKAVGIEVVTDKDEFNKILESEAILQKMSNDDIIRNLAKERDDAIEKKNNINAEKLESFKHDVNSHSSLIKELIKAGNTLLENGFDLGDLIANSYSHNLGFILNFNKVKGVGFYPSSIGYKSHIYSDGENISIGPDAFVSDWQYDSFPKRWLEGLQSFKTQLSEIYGLNFDNVEMEEVQKNEDILKDMNSEKTLKTISNKNEFNELVWNYGASGTKVFDEYQLSEEQKETVSLAWSEYENNENDISEEKADEIINSYYSSFNSNKAKENVNTAELSQEDIEVVTDKNEFDEVLKGNSSSLSIQKIDMKYDEQLCKNTIASWTTSDIYDEADGLDGNEIFQKYDNIPVPIAILPERAVIIFNNLSNRYIYSGKAYFIDHMVNHHAELDADEFQNFQDDLNSFEKVYLDPKNSSIIFEKDKNNKKYSIVLKQDFQGNLLFYKSYHYGSKTKNRFVEIDLEALREKISVEVGNSSINHPDEPGLGRLLSALTDINNLLPKFDSVNKVKQSMKLSDGTTYGFVHNGKIYLNPEIMNSNAAVHEYTHLWDAYSCITIGKRKVIQLYL